jgi:inhibitor of the pro-sigma K processing machinery
MKGIEFIIIIGVCVAIIVAAILCKKVEWVVNFVLRAVAGILILSLVNTILTSNGVQYVPGINGVNIVSMGFLGLPGVILLYGITTYYLYGK